MIIRGDGQQDIGIASGALGATEMSDRRKDGACD